MNQNYLIAEHLNKIALLYQIKDDKWRATATSRAAENVGRYRDPITVENATKIDGVGTGLAETIAEFQRTGTSEKWKALSEEIDPQCLTMTVVKGIGPKTAWGFYQVGVKNFDSLVRYWKKGQIEDRWDEPIRQALARKEARVPHMTAAHLAYTILDSVRAQPGVIRSAVAGSVRRLADTSKDLDILVSAATKKERLALIKTFCQWGKVINQGQTKASIWFTLGETTMQADLLVVSDDSFGAALQYFTGSREHNIQVRAKAQELGYKVNEFGIYRGRTKVGGAKEEDIYNVIGMTMPAPEDR